MVDPRTRQVTPTTATVVHENTSVDVSGHFVVSPNPRDAESRHDHTPRELLAGCTVAQMNMVHTTVPIMVSYVNAAEQYMRDTGGQRTVYTKWFGHDIAAQSVVMTKFKRISDSRFNTFTFNCGESAPDCTDPDDVAYVEPEV